MKTKFERIHLLNRWRMKKHNRNNDWTIIGISQWWCHWDSYCYKFCVLGLELSIWFKRN